MTHHTPDTPLRRMPPEWDAHEATWIAWPHHEPDWPGKLDCARWVYAEIVRVLAQHERVEILCRNEEVLGSATEYLHRNGVSDGSFRLHIAPTDRTWLRDSGPTAVRAGPARLTLIDWRFNAWAKYDNHVLDDHVPLFVSEVTGLERVEARRPDRTDRLVLEGGAIDTDGAGTLLTTEECLLSDVQCRNPGMTREAYEHAFAEYLGISKTLWLGSGCEGDDTHGHVDDIARFVAPGVILLAVERDSADGNHASSMDNLHRLSQASDAQGRPIKVVELPFPRPVIFEGQRLPASYANFYIANGVVLVPTFNDVNDRLALDTIARQFPNRQVVGIHSVDLVWGLGTLHCLTQQQPAR